MFYSTLIILKNLQNKSFWQTLIWLSKSSLIQESTFWHTKWKNGISSRVECWIHLLEISIWYFQNDYFKDRIDILYFIQNISYFDKKNCFKFIDKYNILKAEFRWITPKTRDRSENQIGLSSNVHSEFTKKNFLTCDISP